MYTPDATYHGAHLGGGIDYEKKMDKNTHIADRGVHKNGSKSCSISNGNRNGHVSGNRAGSGDDHRL